MNWKTKVSNFPRRKIQKDKDQKKLQNIKEKICDTEDRRGSKNMQTGGFQKEKHKNGEEKISEEIMEKNLQNARKDQKDFCFQLEYRSFQQTKAPTAKIRRKKKPEKLQASSFQRQQKTMTAML